MVQIQPGKHCYNVYCRVIKAETTEQTNHRGDVTTVVRGVVADDTGCADFKLVGDHAKLVKEGATIALRNGKSNVVNEHILLELDRFGKVSVEDDSKVKSTNLEKNISEATWEKKAKQN